MARTIRVVAAAMSLLLLLTACQTKGGGSSVEITFQIFGDGAEIAAYQSLIDAYEKETSGADVKLIAVPSQGDHAAKLSAGFAAGNPPDLFLINFRRFGKYAAQGALEPLGTRLENSSTLKTGDFYPQAMDAFKTGQTQHCLPQNISSLVVYYNKALFKKYGVAEPKPGWTWDDYLATAKALTKDTDADGKMDVFGLGIEPNLIRLAPFVWQAGAEVVDNVDTPTKTTMLDAKALNALRFFIDLRRNHRVVPEQAQAKAEDDESRFVKGTMGMFMDSRRAVTSLRQVKNLDWDVAPLPRFRQSATILHSDAYCMSKASKRKDAAFKFVEFALGEKGAALIAKTGRTVPSVKRVAESPAFLDPAQRPANAKVFLDAIPLIRRVPNIANWNEIEKKADPVIEEWFYSLERIEALGIEIDLATRELFIEAPK